MNSLLTVLEPTPSVLTTTAVLAQQGFTCTLLTLEAGAESDLPSSRSADRELLYVIDGDIAIHADGITTIVNRGAAFLLAPDKPAALTARAGQPARVLRVEIPPREVLTPQIITPRA
jgi:redox-sensitive bicupin YhaK (pirin superfamily)